METNANELLEILSEIDEKLDLAQKELLEYKELQETQSKAERILSENISKDTELWREFDKQKTTTYWDIYPKSKYTTETRRLPLWKAFIIRALEAQGIQQNKTQQLIQKGQHFTGRKAIRDIMKNAKDQIDIQDNYPSIELLSIIVEYVEGNANLKVRILTQKSSNSFESDLQAFNKQYSSAAEMRVHQNCHDRFIIIDGQEAFHSGHSFKDLGTKASLISKIEDEDERKKLIYEFEDWWENGTS